MQAKYHYRYRHWLRTSQQLCKVSSPTDQQAVLNLKIEVRKKYFSKPNTIADTGSGLEQVHGYAR
jgi:hypothetical protein